MTQYYYLVASLPMLFFDAAPPLRSADFLESCRQQAPADHAQLARISLDALACMGGDPAAWREYAAWETALRDELAVQRAQRLGLDPAPFLRPGPFVAGLAAIVKEALAAGTPLAIETALDRRRWSRLDELEAGTQFGVERLVVYRLKLLLLERRERFQPEAGRKSFAEGYARILDGAALPGAANGRLAGSAPSPLAADTE